MKQAKTAIIFFLYTLMIAQLGCQQQKATDAPTKRTTESIPDEPLPPPVCDPLKNPLPPSGEGMWPWSHLEKLDEESLRMKGLKIPLKKLWTAQKGGLLSAAVGLRGCSASFVSSDGLMITNHHCAFTAIQRNSTKENNILENGFWAESKDQELDGHGLRAFVFIDQTDVTEQIIADMPQDIDDLDRMRFIEGKEKALVKKCEEKPNTRCRVSRNNDGQSFTLLTNLEFKDVRLVAAPPRTLGEYGGEVDNWQWPRHTLDFSFVRAYVNKDGEPAPYSKDNVPYKPKHHFQISKEGVKGGDMVMVVGTPYRTARYRSSASVKEDLEWYYPLRVDLFSKWITLLDQNCQDTPKACLPTAGMVKSLNNGLTNARGMLVGLKRNKILERKNKQENKWRAWIEKNPTYKTKWASTLPNLNSYINDHRAGRDRDLLIRYMLWGNKLLKFARTITKWARQQTRPDNKRDSGFQERDKVYTLDDIVQAQRSLHVETDKKILAFFIKRLGDLPAGEHIQTFDKALGKNYSAATIQAYVNKLYASSKLDDTKVRTKLFGTDLESLAKSGDSMIALALDMEKELNDYDDRRKTRDGALSRLRPPYIESLKKMIGMHFYPDANASPRISFATVTGYKPRDGVWHTPRTTLAGLAAKWTGQKPFNAPKNIINAISDTDKPFTDKDLNDVPVCFLSNADTTGGNSGSPALDGEGHLVGLNFDRVYENISGDYGYNLERSRNIMVESRAILWYLKRIIRAEALLNELGIK